ncbi:MAG TPA: hypothetical protein VNZ55_00860 [Thermomicrobiales bacterium]|nr:hypothetical protein [Thermomicrobiales bacterium]
MRKVLVALFAMLFMMGGSAGFVAAQSGTAGATPEASPAANGSEAAAGSDTNPVDPAIGDTVTLFAVNGAAVGTMTVTDAERDWQGFDEYQEPENGTEFVAFTIQVESTTSRGSMDISPYDFGLQDGQSFFWSTAYATNEDSGDEVQVLRDELNLAGGETAEFLIVFQVYQDQPLQHLFWSPDDHLVTLADLSDI